MTGPIEVVPGLWRLTATHPEWTEEEGGEDGWDAEVAWWAARTPHGLALIDPLVDDWDALDDLVRAHAPCVGIVRMIHWHERSCAEAAARYGAEVWAGEPGGVRDVPPADHTLGDGARTWDAVQAYSMERDDEIALWLPAQSTLLFADVMIGAADGRLRVCPESWTMPTGGITRLREVLSGLGRLPFERVLVSHGPSARPDGRREFMAALDDGR